MCVCTYVYVHNHTQRLIAVFPVACGRHGAQLHLPKKIVICLYVSAGKAKQGKSQLDMPNGRIIFPVICSIRCYIRTSYTI